MATATATVDERLAKTGVLSRLLRRPELGALIGAAAVFVFFSVQTAAFDTPRGIANFLDVAAPLGIMAVVVAVLMIGGEFDLSAGVMTGSTGLIVAMLTTRSGWNVWAAIAAAFVFAALVGLLNGYLTVSTGLPSFIITLGTFLTLQGANLGVTKIVTGTVNVPNIDDAPGYDSARAILASTVRIAGASYRVSILWWIAVTALGTWVLLRTRAGNWVFGVGGAVGAARSVGVPAARVKISLFVATSLAAALVGTMTAIRLTSVQANHGIGAEFQFIIAAVIGGCLLTGGYGSAVGASLGALIFGMASQGIVFAGWDSDWFKTFLGVLLVLATLLNYFVRKTAEESRR